MPLLPGATGSPAGEGAALGGTKGGLIGAGGAGKSTTEERDLGAAVFLTEAALTGASVLTVSEVTVLTVEVFATAGSDLAMVFFFFSGVSASAFLGAGAFFTGVEGLAGDSAVLALTTGVFFTGTGLESSTAGVAFPFSGAGVEVIFFAAMASSKRYG